MAGALAQHINCEGPDFWIFDTLPTDKGISRGVQPGDILFETTGTHLWVMGNDHVLVALSA